MAHFHKIHVLPVERRISTQAIPVVVPSITIGLWGYLDFERRELDVVADNPGVTAVRKGTVGGSRAWEISANASVRSRVSARTKSGDVWDWVELTFTPRADTAKAAESRSRIFTNQVAQQAAPAGMAATIWTYLLNFTKAHEGCTDFLYNDTGDQPTAGVGLLLNTRELLDKYRSYFRSPTNDVPSLDDLLDDFDAVKPLPRASTLLWHYAEVTGYRIDYAEVAKLLTTTMASAVKTAQSMFSGFGSFPQEAQVATASLAYGGINRGVLAAARAAIQKQDWDTASSTCQVPGWDPKKNRSHSTLFANAAKVARNQIQNGLPSNYVPAPR